MEHFWISLNTKIKKFSKSANFLEHYCWVWWIYFAHYTLLGWWMHPLKYYSSITCAIIQYFTMHFN